MEVSSQLKHDPAQMLMLGLDAAGSAMEGLPRCPYEGFVQFRSKTNEKQTLVDFFLNHGAVTGFKSARNLISVGAGDGDLDSAIICKCLPELTSYTGIECDEENCVHLRKKMKEVNEFNSEQSKQLQIRLVETRVEKFKGPEEPVDVVLMMHLLYYFGDKRPDIIQMGIDWLKPGGHLIIGVVNEGNCIQKLANVGRDNPVSWIKRTSSELQLLGLTYTEFSVAHEFNPEGCDYKFADFVLRKTASEKEIDEILGLLATLKDPGSTVIKHATHIFVIQKH